MSRAARLHSGRHWLRSFSGKRVVRSYARWFGVDLLCAAKELQILGRHFSPEYLDALRRTAASQPRHGRNLRKGGQPVDIDPIWDQEFAYIAGYTEGGSPFGVTSEEMEGAQKQEAAWRVTAEHTDDLIVWFPLTDDDPDDR